MNNKGFVQQGRSAPNLKLTYIAEQYAGNMSWREVVEEDVDLDTKYVFDTHTALSEHISNKEALVFVMRGLGCPYPEARISDVIG